MFSLLLNIFAIYVVRTIETISSCLNKSNILITRSLTPLIIFEKNKKIKQKSKYTDV